mmetsp:Transcript_83457/g.223436  ORF Transcript_83457/g.223436 Transcript_83457/m.223436 type:complete len:228 (-) Transcript_83457:75-758(-)
MEGIHFFPYSGTQEERNEISCIIPNKLYLTNFRGVENAENLEALGIKHIVCINEQENAFEGRFNYFNIKTLEDQEDHDASQYFASVADFTDKALKSGGAVCFHCAAGISRSSTVVIAYLMSSQKIPLLEAFVKVYKARRVVWPNRSFMAQLIGFERHLQKKKIVPGTAPSIQLEQWDIWTNMDQDKYLAALAANISERTASLKGQESAQFNKYLESVLAPKPGASKP